jgi:hypothetical protein
LPDYRDPVERDPFGGAWLAAVEPVVVRSGQDRPLDTGFLVVVQERRDEVMEPVRALQWRLTYGAIGAALFVLTLLALMTVGMMSVFDAAPRSRVTRFLRRWAGLPTGTAGTGTARAAGTVAPGGRTVRAGATPAADSGPR